ncbi:Oxygen-independent coproporphyrinogen-III oxidase [Slackia heliotrinireducens]|uniref:Heme chaperone HemW n=1 Tax=Slackia heliotrinireducens (strain ATCC 29202 / DSM 20476 / NCTC 11029 / RHS 1) TaxID=471855 RepID=C7N580_SLAHD|nr:radical SAM family heme chaperone HemW [Slackia heliotrinireducens]ACV22065.1 putative oxygen-independent coproporphyrinogen III oxidase [Slackia heliotrinireducens DSM 20476]VEH00034.1 Oxygen-independent coproporphyrinogen-III oxidase [Slackia heliotrinireducens]
MAYDPYKALYIHLPFCKHRCAYCDFTTRAIPKDSPEIGEYIENLVLDIRHASREGFLSQIETVYIGGGTPSYIGTKHLSNLLYTLGVSMHLTPEVECSMEANPESVTPELIRDIYALGVNRLSIGVQSFDDELLKRMDRIHDGARAKEAIAMAQERFDNVSVDLMCGIPGQTPEMFLDSVQQAVDLGVKHVSIYPLTIEEHTPLQRMVDAGEIEIPEDHEDREALMMGMAPNVLLPAGFHRYEVASYALDGYECEHNKKYWTGVPYYGIGVSAVTMTQNDSRRMRKQDGYVVDDLNRRQMMAEDLMMKMRMSQGVSVDEVKAAATLLPKVLQVFRDLQKDNLVKLEDDRYKPTLGGWLLGNELYGRIYELAP